MMEFTQVLWEYVTGVGVGGVTSPSAGSRVSVFKEAISRLTCERSRRKAKERGEERILIENKDVLFIPG